MEKYLKKHSSGLTGFLFGSITAFIVGNYVNIKFIGIINGDWLNFFGNIVGTGIGVLGAYSVANWQINRNHELNQNIEICRSINKSIRKVGLGSPSDEDIFECLLVLVDIENHYQTYDDIIDEVALARDYLGDDYVGAMDQNSLIESLDYLSQKINQL